MALVEELLADAQRAEQKEDEAPKGLGIEAYKRMFRRSEEACAEARTFAHRDRDWYDNFNDSQWDDSEKAILKRRNQPIGGSNRIKRKVNFLCGLEQQRRSDPRAFPRNPQDTDAADVITKTLDYVESQTRFDHTASAAFKDLAIEGIEAAEVIIENGDVVGVNLIGYDNFFYDPRSKRKDFADAKYLGYQDWFDLDEAKELFTGEEAQALLEGSFIDVTDEGYEDKPYAMWADSERQRVRIACMYYRGANGVWNYVYFTGAGVLREDVSPYLDDQGKPDCAIIAAGCYMTRKNERYGVVRDMINSQREMNFRRSQSLALLKNRRMWQRGDGILPATAREDVARPDGILNAQGAKDSDWGFIESQSEITGNLELLQEAKQEIDVHGPNAGLQGRGVENQSGRAIALQQNAGMAEENDLFDTHNDWKLRIYRAMWYRVKQFWTAAKFVRVTDDEGAPQFIGINQPMMQQDPMTGQSMPVVDPQTGQPQLENEVAKMDADIILEAMPDAISLQFEQFEQLTQLAAGGIPIPPDVLIEASSLRNKKELLEKMKQQMDAQAQLAQAGEQMKQMQDMIQQLQKQVQDANAMPKPMTALDMARVDTERVKQGQIIAQTDHTKATTLKTVTEIMDPPPPPQPRFARADA